MSESDSSRGTARSEITSLLVDWRNGESEARDRLIALVYEDLRISASRQLGGSQPSSLRPTALVHEAFLKLTDSTAVPWQSRAHFMAVAARAMRQVAIDHARRKAAAKRDGGLRITLQDCKNETVAEDLDVLDLHVALERLAEIHPEKARIVEMHYFGGMSSEEIAEVTGRATITIKRGWRTARAWLHQQMVGP